MDFLQEGKTENLPKRENLSQKKRKRFSLRTPVGKRVIDAESKAIRDASELRHQPVRNEMHSNLTVDNYKSLEDIPNNELPQLRKCLICGKPVQEVDLWPHNGMPATINAAVIGGYIEIYGHRECIYNVDRIVVFQNRMRIKSFIEKLKEKFSSMNEANEMLQGILEMIDLVELDKSW